MKSARIALSLFVLSAPVLAQTSAQKSFDQLKTLAGSWQGTNSEGKPLQVSFRDTAGGSALMSEIQAMGHDNMISMFHLDGPNRLMLTHYCGVGNQPRMAATTSPDGKTITFDFLDATNVDSSSYGRMQRLVITMLDANHHTEEWTFAAAPGKDLKQLFDLKRSDLAQK
jgi:hypothetical protein